MSRRLEIELTSRRADGSWTWRAAGAKQPKGELDGTLVPEGTDVGTVLRADAEFLVDGIEIIGVLPPKAARREPERLELLGSGREEPLVTTQLAPKGRGGRGRRRDEDDRRRGGRDRGEPRDRRPGDRGGAPRHEPVPERPAPKRLRPGRAHRNALLESVEPEMRPIAEQVLRGGIPGVREQANRQNEQARKENRPEIPVDQVVTMAERLLPRLREAEWMDRAEAAEADLAVLDLRDLRSVVVAADGVARDGEARALRDRLSEGLAARVAEEQQLWVSDMEANLEAGRFVRALRISSRPPKAGAPVPKELSARLVAAVSDGLNDRTRQELYAATLDALSYAPMRSQVVPAGRPAEPGEDLLEAVRRVADKLPAIAAMFGVDPKEANAARRRRRAKAPAGKQAPGGDKAPGGRKAPGDRAPAGSGAPGGKAPGGRGAGGRGAGGDKAAENDGEKRSPSPAAEPTVTDSVEKNSPAAEPAAAESPAAEAPAAESPVADTPASESPADDAPVAEVPEPAEAGGADAASPRPA